MVDNERFDGLKRSHGRLSPPIKESGVYSTISTGFFGSKTNLRLVVSKPLHTTCSDSYI